MKSKIVVITLCIVFVASFSIPISQNVSQPSSSSSGSSGLANSPWPMFRQNLRHTGLSPYNTCANDGKLKWSFKTGGNVHSSPIVGPNDMIFIGSDDNKLYAINPNGTEKWNFTTGGWVRSSPAIDSNGIIYVGSNDNKLYAINPNGTKKWSFTTGSYVESSPVISSDGIIYVGSYDFKLYSINPDGTLKWIFKTGGKLDSSPVIDSDGTIYVGSHDYKLYAINPDGTEKWNFTTGGYVYSSPTIGSNTTIYFGSNDYKLHALNLDNNEKWNFSTSSFVSSSPAIWSDGTIYFGSYDHKLYAINPNGSLKWSFTTGSLIVSSPAISFDGTVYIGSRDNKLYAIYPDGTEKWNFSTGSFVHSSPAIGSDGTIYVGSHDGNLYAIGTSNTPPIAKVGFDQIVNEGDIVVLDSSASYDPDGTIESYEWDFESDGIYDYKEKQDNPPDGTFDGKTTYIYGDNGIYTATLRVTDDSGANDTDYYEITVNNVPPGITLPAISGYGEEGSPIHGLIADAIDPGSDDLIFEWDYGDGNFETKIYYNNGTGSEPIYDPNTNKIKSPWGIYPFSVSDQSQHIYGDNGVYPVSITISDDDGGKVIFWPPNSTIKNVPPILSVNIPTTINEGEDIFFLAEAVDNGTDDLIFTWKFGDGTLPIVNTYYNNAPINTTDPYPSPWGIHPFSAVDVVQHTYGDNGVFGLTLTVEDDDGGTISYTTNITVHNVAPSIEISSSYIVDENSPLSFEGHGTDPGSDDLTFTWDWGDGTSDTITIYYNNGLSPDPDPSPDFNPMDVIDMVSHIYGDNGFFVVTLTLEDDDGGIAVISTNVTVNNVAPTISLGDDSYIVDENSPLTLNAHLEDPGSDDLTCTWEFEYGPTMTYVYYNNGVSSDPYPSPEINPMDIMDSVTHTYGDNGVFVVTLTVEDDDGGVTIASINVTVNNVSPEVVNFEAYMYVNFSLRVAGEKWHSVDIYLHEDGSEIEKASVTRYPGDPDEQMATMANAKVDMTKSYTALVDYLPNDPRINGNVWGGNPIWIIMTFEDGSETKLHHTFNVRKSYWNDDHWNHIDPWEVEFTPYFGGHNITFEASVEDPGSDDLTFTWDFGDGNTAGPTTFYNDGVGLDPMPSPEINPMAATDSVIHSYSSSGTYTITLTVTDDDGGVTIISLEVVVVIG